MKDRKVPENGSRSYRYSSSLAYTYMPKWEEDWICLDNNLYMSGGMVAIKTIRSRYGTVPKYRH